MCPILDGCKDTASIMNENFYYFSTTKFYETITLNFKLVINLKN